MSPFNNKTVCDSTIFCGLPKVEFGENHTANVQMGPFRDSVRGYNLYVVDDNGA